MATITDIPIKQRLLSAGGHLKAVTAMVESNAPKENVIFQLDAVQGAIKAVTQILLEECIDERLGVVLSGKSGGESREALDSLLVLYNRSINQK